MSWGGTTGLSGIGIRTVIAVAACCILPVLAISAIVAAYAGSLPVRFNPSPALTTLSALQQMLLHPSAGHRDSWNPMLHALSVLKSQRDHAHLYETIFFQQGYKFQYPPTSLLPIDLLQHLGMASVASLNRINLGVFLLNAFALAWIAARLFSPEKRTEPRSTHGIQILFALTAFCAAFFFDPLVRGKMLGQIQLWIDLLFTLTALCWICNRRLLAGFFIGLACCLKPQAAILLLWALAWKEWKIALGVAVAIVPVTGASLLAYGVHNHLTYFQILSFLSAHGEVYYANASMNGLLNRYLHNGDSLVWHFHKFPPYNPIIYYGTLIFGLATVIAMLAPAWRNRGRATGLDLGTAFICSVMISPIAWEHHYGILLAVYLMALRAGLDGRGGRANGLALAALALSWALAAAWNPLTALVAETPYNILQSYTFVGALILFGLTFWWRKKEFLGI